MPGILTEITEIGTALGTLVEDVDEALSVMPSELANVPLATWERLRSACQDDRYLSSFEAAHRNGSAFRDARDGLRGRPPQLVEWKGPHQQPGDDPIPADLRIDHVYLISCKYLSKVLLNCGPARLFQRLLVGIDRSRVDWFTTVAEDEFLELYRATKEWTEIPGLPDNPSNLTRADRQELRKALPSNSPWPLDVRSAWSSFCSKASGATAEIWRSQLTTHRARLNLFLRLLRISGATYFVLGQQGRTAHTRLRVASIWDWTHAFELLSFHVESHPAGQVEVAWTAQIRDRASGGQSTVTGHVEVRWSHGRFGGHPEAKVYLDTDHSNVPGYFQLT